MQGILRVRPTWLTIELDHEIGRYYRNLFLLTYGFKLQRPSNGEHITVISEKDNIQVDNEFEGIPIKFRLGTTLTTNGNAICLRVFSFEAVCIRCDYGLLYRDLHFCIGYEKNNE